MAFKLPARPAAMCVASPPATKPLIDFEALDRITPEEAAAIWEADCRAHQERREALVSERTAKIEALVALLGHGVFGEWEERFVRDLHYMATTFDMDGMLGGRLSTLSDKQVPAFERLCTRHSAEDTPAPAPRR